MTIANLTGGEIDGAIMKQLLMDIETVTLAGALSLQANAPSVQFLDPGGAGRTITLPAEADSTGKVFLIFNTADAAEILTIQDDTPTTLVTPTENEVAVVACNGTAWHGFVAIAV